jgi:hypothetical protein
MRPGARSPEELETLFEDAFVLRDRGALVTLFEDGGVLAAAARRQVACGEHEIGRAAVAMWERDRAYIADTRRVLQAGDTALVVAGRAINVARRASDGSWRYAIALLAIDQTNTKEDR